MPQKGDPAIALLLGVARARLDDETRARVRALAASRIEWPAVLRKAARHGLLPLLAHHLEEHAADALPGDVMASLRDHRRAQAARNLQATSLLFRLLDLLAAGGIEAMPYKGPALAAALYGNLALRQFVDLDLLVRPRDVPRASALLAAAGWRPHFPLEGARLAAHVRLSYVQLFQREGECAVELHWGIAPRFFGFALDVEALWPRLQRLALAGRPVLAPDHEDLIAMLAVHGAKDLWERLEWVAAIGELARDPGLDWDRVLGAVRPLGGERMVLLAVELARRLVGATPPAGVVARLARDRATERLAGEVERRLLADDAVAIGLLERTWFHLAARERWSDRTRYCTRLLFTTTANDWAAAPLPESLAFLHPAVRAVRLTGKYLGRRRTGQA